MCYESSRTFHEQLSQLVDAYLADGGDPADALVALELQTEALRVRTNADRPPDKQPPMTEDETEMTYSTIDTR